MQKVLQSKDEKVAYKLRVNELKNRLPTCYAVRFEAKNNTIKKQKLYDVVNLRKKDLAVLELLETMFP